jgi:non-ribosomal peptide synthetase-like protein
MSVRYGTPVGAETTLTAIFSETVSRSPKACAIDTEAKSISYRQLQLASLKLAQRLNHAGIGVGDRVAIQLPTENPDLFISILGVLLSGAAYVPVDAEDSPERMGQICRLAGVVGRITARGLEVSSKGEYRAQAAAPHDDAYVIFTSGSTGTPKAVAVTHAAAANLVLAEQNLFCRDRPLGEGSRVAASLSPAFDASIEEMWLAWSSGATLVPLTRRELTSGPDLASHIRKKRLDALSTVPSIATFLQDCDLGSLRLMILGGEPVSKDLARGLSAARLELWNTYGPTEATVIATAVEISTSEVITIGEPLAGYIVAVLTDGEQLAKEGEVGELVIAGKGLARYLDAEQDSRKFKAIARLGLERAYFTGDQVQVTRHGLVFVGRLDDQVKVAGKRLELLEVEAAANEIKDVKACVALVTETESNDSELVCFLTVGPNFTLEEFQRSIGKKLPAGVRPSVHLVKRFPLRASGKVDKAALEKLLAKETPNRTVAPSVIGLFAKTLGVDSVEADSNFFELGGTSIKVAKLVVQLRSMHPNATVVDVYRNPTPRQLEAALIGKVEAHSRSEVRYVGVTKNPLSRGVASVLLHLAYGAALGAFSLALLTLYGKFGLPSTLMFLVFLAIVASTFGRAFIAGVLIRLLVLGIRSGSYTRNGLVHLRIWLAERITDVCTVIELEGTPWMVLFAKTSGSKIGAQARLRSLPPVLGNLKVGSGSTIGRDVHLSGWHLEGDVLTVGNIAIGANAMIANRVVVEEGVTVGDRAIVAAGSLLAENVSNDAKVHGSPLQSDGEVQLPWPARPAISRNFWQLIYAATPAVLGAFYLLQFLPAIAIVGLNLREITVEGMGWALIQWSLVLGPSSLVLNSLLTALLIRLANLFVRPGCFEENSREGYASWLVERLIQRSRVHSYWIYASVITPFWARLLGAKVGRNCEISTFNGQIGLVSISDECFLADDTSLAARETLNGWVRLDGVELERRSFIGNSAHVPAGTIVSSGVLAGVASSVPRSNESGSSYLGLPPIEFPREVLQTNPTETYQPSRMLRLKRSLVEVFRVAPAVTSYCLAGLIFVAVGSFNMSLDPLTWVLTYSLAYLCSSYAAGFVTAVAKWLLVGRVRPSNHSLWTNFVWRNELVWNFVESLAIPWLSAVTIDSPVHNFFVRILGARIGRNASLSTWFVDDPDLVNIGANAVIAKSADLQTHLFQDRLMQLNTVSVGTGSTIGAGSFILPGASIGPGSTVSACSLVPRDEALPSLSLWRGNPVET